MRKNDVSATLATAVPMPEGKLTRSEVARRLGVSRTTLRRLEGTALHPVPGPRGVRFFEESEVQAYLIAYRGTRGTAGVSNDDSAGDHAAEAFERFDQGASTVEVVKALRLEPHRVTALYEAWLRMK